MAKKQNTANIHLHKVLTLVSLALIVATAVSGYLYIRWDLGQHKRYDTELFRSMVLSAVENLNTPLPQDARTGEYYIREHNLVVSYDVSLNGLEYRANIPNDIFTELTRITSPEIRMQSLSDFRSGQDIETLFEVIPYLQACSRGISIDSKILTDTPEMELYRKKTLRDGRTIYIYTENNCPDQKNHVETIFQNLQSY